MALVTLATTGDSGAASLSLEMLAGDPVDAATTGDAGAVAFTLDLIAVVPQQLATTGDSGSVGFSLEMLAGDPVDAATTGDSGSVTLTIEALEGGYYYYEAYAEPSTGHVSFFAYLDGGYVEPDVQAAPTDGCGIKQLYERSLMGYYPLYFYDLTTLAHKGWYPHWCVMWIENAAGGASWSERTNDTSIWNERTNSAAAWKERA